MKKTAFLLLSLTFVIVSCYPPRIIYSIKDVQPPLREDSIGVQLIKGSTITTGGSFLYLSLYLEIMNNRGSNIFAGKNSTLELQTDSAVLQYEISLDSLVYQLKKNERKSIRLHFHSTDIEHIAYTTVKWPSIWSFMTLKDETPRHKLFLFLDLQDENDKKIEKCIILKPTGTKRM